MRASLRIFIIFFGALSGSVLFAQPLYNANQQVKPYTGGFHTGVNNGYFPGWTNAQLGALAAQSGARAMRLGFTEEIAELFGYDILLPLFEWYGQRGMKDHTLTLNGPVDWHRDETYHCPQARSALFKNLYLPVWDGGANGTPYNDENYFAAYTYKMVSTYKGYVRFWEVWNEPGFDLTGGTGWLPPGHAKNWWENNPDPCDYILHAPVQHYIRTLRVAWEVIKTVDPDAYVTCSGVGYPAFLDALLRQTDNPDAGKVTPDFPLKGGAYFDAVGFHAYPHFDGSVRYWDNACQCMVNKRHSDGAADGIVRNMGIYADVLSRHGYNRSTFPEKVWNLTEINIPAKSFVWGSDQLLGGPEVQRNFIVKAVVRMMQKEVAQFEVFQLFNLKTAGEAQEAFEVMGLYEKSQGPGTVPVPSMEGVAYESAARHLYGTTYDPARTAALQLTGGAEGAAFRTHDGSFVYVLWAKTFSDQQESAAVAYTLPAALQGLPLYERTWEFSRTLTQKQSSGGALSLTETPVFLVENSNWAIPPTDTRPKIDLQLSLTAVPARPQKGQEVTFILTLSNTGTVRATNVEIVDFMEFEKPFLTDRLRYVAHQAPAGTLYAPQKGRWAVPAVEAGQQLTLQVTAKALHDSPYRAYAQVGRAAEPDLDSRPLDGQSNKIPFEDDEAVFIINDNGWVDVKADLVVETMRFARQTPSGTSLPLTHMVRNNGNAAAPASVVRYFLSTDSLWSPADLPLGEYTVQPLAPFAYETRQTTLALPSALPDGPYYLLFWCDATGSTDEYDEYNVFARPLRVVNPVPLISDLQVQVIAGPDTMLTDRPVPLKVVVSNIGNAVSEFYNLFLYVSGDTLVNAGDLALYGTLFIPLSPLQSDTVTILCNAPLSYFYSGHLWLVVEVQASKPGTEATTLNNRDAHPVVLRLRTPEAGCRTDLGAGQVLCVEHDAQGTTANVYRHTQREWFKYTLDAKGSIQQTAGPFPLVYDSVLVGNQVLTFKKADGTVLLQRALPSALLNRLPAPEAAARLDNGHFVVGGFRKYYDPQGIRPLNADTLLLFELDGNLNLLRELPPLARNTSVIANDLLHALIPVSNDRVTCIFTTSAEYTIVTRMLNFMLYDLNTQSVVRQEVKQGFYLQQCIKTPCGDWKIATDYQLASIKGSSQGHSVFHLDADNAATHHTWSVGAGSLDYFGSYKTYSFAGGPPDSLTAGFGQWRSMEPLPDLVLRYRRPDGSLFLDTVPFVQFQYITPVAKSALFIGSENDRLWVSAHDCGRTSAWGADPGVLSPFRVFPNPGDGWIGVEHPETNDAELLVYHSTGACLLRQSLSGTYTTLDLRHLAAGTYFLLYRTPKGRMAQKIIIAK